LLDLRQGNGGIPQLRLKIQQEAVMIEKVKSEVISRRRVFSLFGLAIGSSLAVPAMLMTATDAEAVVGRPLSPVSVAGAARRADRRGYKKKKMKATPATTEPPK
jgi:hypothetical protein